MAHTIYASFADAALAEKAVGALLDHGAENKDISLVSRERNYDLPKFDDEVHASAAVRERERELAYAGSAVGASSAPSNTMVIDHNTGEGDKTEFAAKQGISTTTGADAADAAVTGTGIGLGVGALAALASLMIPGFGIVIGGGALATALAGAAGATAAGAIAGGVTGYLKDQGVPEHVATDYSKAVENGGAFLTIEVPTGSVDRFKAEEIIGKYNATNINAYGFA